MVLGGWGKCWFCVSCVYVGGDSAARALGAARVGKRRSADSDCGGRVGDACIKHFEAGFKSMLPFPQGRAGWAGLGFDWT
jgi:hypothetical protein